MTQKPKEQDIEQVKTLLRRLEELPQDQASANVRTATSPRKTATADRDAKAPRPTLIDTKHPANDHRPLPLQSAVDQEPLSLPVEKGASIARWFIGGAVVAGGCASLYFALHRGDVEPRTTASASIRSSVPDRQAAITAASNGTTVSERSRSTDTADNSPFATAAAAAPGGQAAVKQAEPPAASTPSAPGGETTLTTAERVAQFVAPVATVPVREGTAGVPAEQQQQAAPVQSPQDPVVKSPAIAAGPAAVPNPARPPLPDAEVQDEELLRAMVAQGQHALTLGQIASARLLFRRAADSGSAEGALLLGDTFDPERLRALGVRGVAGEVEQAIRWYEKADELGSATAKSRLMSISGR